MSVVAAMQIDRKQAGKNVLLHFIAPARLLQGVLAQPLQLTAQPAAQQASLAAATARVLNISAHSPPVSAQLVDMKCTPGRLNLGHI